MGYIQQSSADTLDITIDNGAKPWTYPLQIALFTGTGGPADPGGGGTLPSGVAPVTGEVSITGTAYARQTVTWGAAVVAEPASISNSAPINWAQATADWAAAPNQVTGWALYDQQATPVGVFSGAFDAAKEVRNLDTVSIATGNLTLTLT